MAAFLNCPLRLPTCLWFGCIDLTHLHRPDKSTHTLALTQCHPPSLWAACSEHLKQEGERRAKQFQAAVQSSVGKIQLELETERDALQAK